MSSFVTDEILRIFYLKLTEQFSNKCQIMREYTYTNKRLPFKALHMGKNRDEYFLDTHNRRIPTGDLLNNLDLLLIKEFQDYHDLSLENKQAKTARSIADIDIEHESVQIVIELEIFKDKPFSNLIYIPERCKSEHKRKLCFLHCFAPLRFDKEAELTRRIGLWLQKQPEIHEFEYVSLVMPSLPATIKYLLPNKRAKKPDSYLYPQDRMAFKKYIFEFCEQSIITKVNYFLKPSSHAQN